MPISAISRSVSLAVVTQRVPDRAHRGDDEPRDVADAVEEPPGCADQSVGTGGARGNRERRT